MLTQQSPGASPAEGKGTQHPALLCRCPCLAPLETSQLSYPSEPGTDLPGHICVLHKRESSSNTHRAGSVPSCAPATARGSRTNPGHQCWVGAERALSPSGTSPAPRDSSYLAGCHILARLLGEDGSVLCLGELACAEPDHLANVLPWGLQQAKHNGPKVLHSHRVHWGVPHGQLCMERLIPAGVQPSSEEAPEQG